MYRESLRRKFSALLMNTDEQHPMSCEVLLEEEIFGLSTLQIPKCIGVFQEPKEGIIWFIIEYFENPVEFDNMFITDLINIYNELCMGA